MELKIKSFDADEWEQDKEKGNKGDMGETPARDFEIEKVYGYVIFFITEP